MKNEVVKKNYISVLSVISCFLVVVLHANGTFSNYANDSRWWIANVVECICFVAVPIFLMISGATLMDYRDRYDSVIYTKKRMEKTVLPYIVWIVIAVFFRLAIGQFTWGDLSSFGFWWDCFFWHYSMFFVYAFFMYLFAIYVSIPILSLIPKDRRRTSFAFMILMFFVFGSLLPFIAEVFGFHYDTQLNIAVCGGYLVYPLMGYYIDNFELTKGKRAIIYVLGIIGFLGHIFGNFFVCERAGAYDETFEQYLAPTTILFALAVFTFAKYAKESKVLETITKPFNSVTFGIYLVHMFVYIIAEMYYPGNPDGLLFRSVGAVVVFLISALLVWVMQLIPGVKKIVPR